MSRWRERGKVAGSQEAGSRLCVASFHAAPRPGHETTLIEPALVPPGYSRYTAIFRCSTGAPEVRLSAASMIAFASMP